MKPKIYRVVCIDCGSSDTVEIDKNRNIFWRTCKNIISGRFRLDMQWGWQCLKCGNNDLETTQERTEIRNLASPDPGDITRVLDSLKPEQPKFRMEPV